MRWRRAAGAIVAAVAMGCLTLPPPAARAEAAGALFWDVTQEAAQSYRMRLGAQLPARRLPARWQVSLGTEIGFGAATPGGRRDRVWSRPAGSLPAGSPPVGSSPGGSPPGVQPDPTCRFWGAAVLPGTGAWLPGWRDLRLDMGYDPAARRGALALTTRLQWRLGGGLTAGMTDRLQLFLRDADHMAPRWRGATSVKLDFSPTGTQLRLDAGRTQRGRGFRRALTAEQRVFGSLTLSAAMDQRADGTTGRRIGASYRPWQGLQLSAGQRGVPGRRPERSLRFRLVQAW